MKSINTVFTEHCSIKFDREFILRVLTFVDNFVRKDENSISFWGGNLLGVYPVKWVNDDKLTWIEDVLKINDYDQLCRDIADLPDVDSSWSIAGDPVNLSFIWVAQHALIFMTLSPKDRETLATYAINMLQYKFITSIHTHNFKHSANLSVALAVYEGLDKKSQLKRLGSWGALVASRTEDILSMDGLHKNTIRNLNNDINVIKMVNDIYNRIKSILKVLTRDFYNIKNSNARIAASDKFTTVDGESLIKDSVNKYAHIKESLHGIIPDLNTFLRDDLLNVVNITINTTYPLYLKSTLTYISSNYEHHNVHKLPELVDDILMFVFDILRKDKIELGNLPAVGIKLKGVLRASRITAPEYVSIRERMGIIVKLANPTIADCNIASTRISTVMYIALRALLL